MTSIEPEELGTLHKIVNRMIIENLDYTADGGITDFASLRKDILNLISQREREARIDELERHHSFDQPADEIAIRINQLKKETNV